MLATPKRFNLVSASHARAKVQEGEIAKRVGGQKVKGSGSGNEKGDVRLKKFVRIEAKTTKHKSFSITDEMIEKLENMVLGSGEIPMFQIEVCGGTTNKTCVVMPEWALDLIIDALRGRE